MSEALVSAVEIVAGEESDGTAGCRRSSATPPELREIGPSLMLAVLTFDRRDHILLIALNLLAPVFAFVALELGYDGTFACAVEILDIYAC